MTMSKKKELTVQINAVLWEDFTKIHHKFYGHSTLELSKLVSNLVDMAIDNFIDKVHHPNGNIHDYKEYLSKFNDSSSDN